MVLYGRLSKYKQFTLLDQEDGRVSAIGCYQDSFHELTVTLAYEKATGRIVDYHQKAVRVPFPACQELDDLHRDLFLGKNLLTLTKRGVGKLSGGSSGCYHLVDIVADLAQAAQEVE